MSQETASYKNLILSDYHRWYPHRIKDRMLFPFRLLFHDRLSYCFWLRTGGRILLKSRSNIIWKIPLFIVSLIHNHNSHRLGIQVPLGCTIDGGLRFAHYGGIVLATVKIDKNCTIHQNCTIGRSFGDNDGTPTIGDNVIIFAGSTIIGRVSIGDNVIIGANTLVTKNIPDNSVVFGNPMRVSAKKPEMVINDNWAHYFKGY